MLPFLVALLTFLEAAPPAGVEWRPTLASEFDGTSLDDAWSPDYPGTSIWNGEAQAYMPSQAVVADGLLRLRAEKIPTTVFGAQQPYRSGIATTRGRWSQRYGCYFEIRARVPSGKGFWPAFWGLPPGGTWPPEIDVLEILGDAPSTLHMTSHWGIQPLHLQKGRSWKGPDFSADFHRFGLEWTPRSLRWFVDDTLRAETREGIPQEPFYWLLNLAVGGEWPGYPDSTTVFPAEYQIDWARAWQFPSDSLSSFPTPPAIRWTHPAPGAFVPLSRPATLALSLDSGSPPAQVRWYDGSTLLRTVAGGSLSTTWTPTLPGTHAMRAVALDAQGTWSSFVARAVLVSDSTGNLVANGSFSNGQQGWTLSPQQGASATFATEPWRGVMRGVVHPISVGTESWHIQLAQPLPMAAGWRYTLSFDASATSPRTFVAIFQQGQDPWTEHWSRTASITTDSVHFGPWAFVAETDDPSAVFKFNLGADSASVRLWDVRVEATPPPQRATSRPAPTTPPFSAVDVQGRPLSEAATGPSGPRIERSSGTTRRSLEIH